MTTRIHEKFGLDSSASEVQGEVYHDSSRLEVRLSSYDRPGMSLQRARFIALLVVLLTPFVGAAVIEYRWQGHCRYYVHESFWLFAIFAVALVATRNPLRAIAGCLCYLPVGYIFAVEPCTAPRSQGAGGLIYVISPMFVGFVVVGAFVGGFLLRHLFGLKKHPKAE